MSGSVVEGILSSTRPAIQGFDLVYEVTTYQRTGQSIDLYALIKQFISLELFSGKSY